MDSQTTIDDVIIEGFQQSRDLLFKVFDVTDAAELVPFSKVLAALRMLNDQLLAQVAEPLIVRMFDEIGADPKTSEGRAKAAPFADSIAFAIQDAYQLILGQMQHQAEARAAIAQGRPQLLKG